MVEHVVCNDETRVRFSAGPLKRLKYKNLKNKYNKMKEYKLRCDGKGNLDYTERKAEKYNRILIDKPTDKFGKTLEETIRRLAEKFPNKSIDVHIYSW